MAKSYNDSYSATYNDELLKQRVFNEFGIKEGDIKLNLITTKTSGGYGLTTDGSYVNLKTHDLVGGLIKYNSSGYSHMHISPKFSKGNLIDFKAVTGHELIHAYHYATIPKSVASYSETVAYNYTAKTYLLEGQGSLYLTNTLNAISNGYMYAPVNYYYLPFYLR
jgi:hypothetical protein